ncbi:MAG: DnaA ATPase domain-containing protein [Planctomycetota bacterium]
MSAEPEARSGAPPQQAPGSDALGRWLERETDFGTREEFWQAVQRSIRERLGLERFSLWFRQTELMAADEKGLVVGVPNVIIQQYLTARYAAAVADAVAELVGRSMDVKFDVAPSLFRQMKARLESEREQPAADASRVVNLRTVRARRRCPTEWQFENLIVCPSSRLPFAAARELAGQENPRFRLLCICGDYGLGKTALLRATFALAAAPERGLAPLHMSAEDWCNEYYLAIQKNTTHLFRSRYRSCDLLLLDDLQFVEGKPGGQRELLHTVKHILGAGGRVAFASTPHPQDLQEIDPAFRALLEGAFPAVLVPPPPDERLQIVKELAARRGLDAVEDVFRLIAETAGDSFTAMESAVSRLALYASVAGCGTMQLRAARDAFAAMRPATRQPVNLPLIEEAVVELLPVTAEQIVSRSRSRSICRARQIAICLSRRHTDASLTDIGRAFGGLTHSTVKYSAEKIERRLDADTDLAALLKRLEKRLGV